MAVGILPIALSASVGLAALIRLQQAQNERVGRELTRALATAVDAELRRSISVIETLGTSPTLDDGDLVAFRPRAERVAAMQTTWLAIVLARTDGTPILRTGALGDTPPPLPEPEMLQQAVRTQTAVVGGLAPGAADWPSFGVYVPVLRDGAVRYVAVALVRPDAMLDILTRQRVPEDWVISVFDRRGLRVARSRKHAENLGTPGAPTLVALMAQPANEGWGPTTALEGDPVYAAYSRLPDQQWSVATGVPTYIVDAAARRSALAMVAGLLASLLIGGAAAFGIGRGITVPMDALRVAASALGRGAPFQPPTSQIDEIRRVGDALAIAADDRARGEAERDALLQRAQEARRVAEQANRAKDEFLAMLGHELRNPLGAISNAVTLLERPDAPDAAKRRMWPIVTRQTAHLLRLMDDLLDAGRAITGKIELERHSLDLAATVRQALRTVELAGRFGARNLVADLQPVWADADPTRIEQIVSNLVGNAIKFTAPDGTITVTVTRDGDAAELRVADDGIGMTPDLVARVFDLFVQGEQPLDRTEGGLGIGLTLVRRLAELHDGTATVTSVGPGRGTVVCVRLPAQAAPEAHVPAAIVPTGATGTGRDVLIVEDNDDARESLSMLLELNGHRVRTAADGRAGLAAFASAAPEVALIDVGLPGIDGYEVARRIRAVPGPRILLLALTGYGLPEDRDRALAAGFDAHLVKPVDPDALEALLRQYAGRTSPS